MLLKADNKQTCAADFFVLCAPAASCSGSTSFTFAMKDVRNTSLHVQLRVCKHISLRVESPHLSRKDFLQIPLPRSHILLELIFRAMRLLPSYLVQRIVAWRHDSSRVVGSQLTFTVRCKNGGGQPTWPPWVHLDAADASLVPSGRDGCVHSLRRCKPCNHFANCGAPLL